jgi:hypothetical protein
VFTVLAKLFNLGAYYALQLPRHLFAEAHTGAVDFFTNSGH